MSSFYAFDFIFDDIPSQKFGLKILTFEGGGVVNGVGSSDVSIISQRVLRKSKPYYLGRTQEPVLEFPLTFGSPSEINAIDRDIISAWLFGRSNYKRLYILQDDLQNIHFNCFMTRPEPIYVGGINYAFTCQVVCDSPFAYGPERTFGASGGLNNYSASPLAIFNSSSEDEFLYPVVEIVTKTEEEGNHDFGAIAISNSSIGTKDVTFGFTGLQHEDTITVDNDLQIITATSGDLLISKLYKKYWFKLIPGMNNLLLAFEDIESYSITFRERFKVGG